MGGLPGGGHWLQARAVDGSRRRCSLGGLLMRERRLGYAALIALCLASAGCVGVKPSGSVLTAARRLDETEAPPLLEPPSAGRLEADRNGDGALDPDEWLTWEWSGVLRREDRNLDGKVSEPEWLAAKCEFDLPHGDTCAQFHTRRFQRLDKDRNREIDRREWSVVSMDWFQQNDHNRDCLIRPALGEPRGAPGPVWPCSPDPRP